MVTQTPDGKILFQFYRPGARQMVIAGDFNGWQHTFHMARGRDGWWRSQIELAPGTYRFRYLADGQWYTDYAAFGVEPGPFGWNSVLKVDGPPAHAAAALAAPAHAAVPALQSATPWPELAEPPIQFVPAAAAPAEQASNAQPERRVRRRPALTS